MEKYLKYLDRLIRAADFSEQVTVDLVEVLHRDGVSQEESLDALNFMEKSNWLTRDGGPGQVRLTLLGRMVWQRNHMLAVHTILVSESEAAPDGHEGVYATIRNDYARDDNGRPLYGKEYGFQMWGVRLKGPLPETTAGFSSVEEAEEAARNAYKDIRAGKRPETSKNSSEQRRQLKQKVTKRQQNIFSKLVALTKEIRLKQPNGDSLGLHQFLGGDGKTKRIMKVSGLVLNWWFSERSRIVIDELVEMALDEIPDLKFGNRTSLGEVITETLKDNAFNRELFGEVFLGDATTLFEARASSSVDEFAAALWDRLARALTSSISKWLIVFPALRLKSETVEIGSEGLMLISPSDDVKWSRLTAQYKINPDWDPKIGGSKQGGNLSYFIKEFPFTWIACEVAGTRESGRELAGRRIRKLIAVLFAVLYQKDRWILSRSASRVPSDSIQFPDQTNSETFTQIMSHIGELLPPFGKDVELSLQDLDKIKEWYVRFESCPDEIKSRCTAASQFVNYGIVSGELERFIHFSISLDALFGVRGNVEKTIARGLLHLYSSTGDDWEYRASRLFDLRSTLVHGGSASIDEWTELEPYRKHTRSHPLRDVTDASMKALWLFPATPALYPVPQTANKVRVNSLVKLSLAFLGGVYIGTKLPNRS
jgi:hypothetical protein